MLVCVPNTYEQFVNDRGLRMRARAKQQQQQQRASDKCVPILLLLSAHTSAPSVVLPACIHTRELGALKTKPREFSIRLR